ncbi:MAG: hypothetical protein LWX55_16515 [Deltaproteobacteria bacterium]|jgi:predicted DNA-binding transcriptional regulator AlpA|nr:hypothetical protein [Deltaproteobacteria bacterium]
MAIVRGLDTAGELTEEYLTVAELSARVKFSRQSLYNLIHKRTFVLGKHFLKPTPKKILFKWSEIQAWMGETSGWVKAKSESAEHRTPVRQTKVPKRANPKSLINV